MAGRRSRSRAPAALAGREKARAAAARLGGKIETARRRRGWSLRELGDRVGLSGQRVGAIVGSRGSPASLEIWFALAATLELPLHIDLGRDRAEDTADAGHLRIQELLL